MTRAALLALPLLGLVAACSFEPHLDRPKPAVPPSWPVGDAYLRQSEAALPSVSYRDIFKDPRLQAIIESALANNQDLSAALANVLSARAQYRVQRADLLPAVDAEAGVTLTHSSNAQSSGTGTGTGSRDSTAYRAEGVVSAWEIDLFGRVRSLTHSQFDLYLGQEAAARATRLTLVSEVASAYLQLAADRSLLAVALDTSASAKTSVDLTRARLDHGIAPRTDLRQAETVLATADADIAAQRTAVAQDLNALELLVGAKVDEAQLPSGIDAIDGMLGELPAGLDSSILLRRPDVVEAEFQLRAANARIGAARAAFLPRISLTSMAGFASTALSGLFTGGAFTWSVAPSATLPIFDGGANLGNLAYAKAQRDFYLAGYQKAIQSAFRDVADALARRGTIDQEVAADKRNLDAAADSFTLSNARYKGGIDPYLTTLDAQRTLYAARRTFATIRLTKANNLVALYQALGGDQLLSDLPDTPAAQRQLKASDKR